MFMHISNSESIHNSILTALHSITTYLKIKMNKLKWLEHLELNASKNIDALIWQIF